MNDWAPILDDHDYRATIEARGARDAVTWEPVDIARVTWKTPGAAEVILLCSRYPGSDWFPTWIGEAGANAVRLPKGFKAPVRILLAIDRAWEGA